MRFILCRESKITKEPAWINIEPESEKDRETMERLLSEFPDAVKGFGRNPESMKMMHMQLAIHAQS